MISVRDNSGFTLLELLVVITIVALLITVTGVKFYGKQNRNLESIARLLVSDLRYVRSRAVVGNNDAGLIFDVKRGAYYSSGEDIHRVLPADVKISLTIHQGDIDGYLGRINFYPDGSSSGGSILLEHNRRQLEVETIWLNGQVNLRSAS